jgi:N-acetylneuraminic acid mutarotase
MELKTVLLVTALIASATACSDNDPNQACPGPDCPQTGWQPLNSQNNPTARVYHTAIWTGSEMIVWGGKDKVVEDTDTGALYDPANDEWRAMATAGAPLPREVHTAVWTGSKMLVWGGAEHYTMTFYSDGASYDPAADEWRAMSGVNAPFGRMLHSATWIGSEMIIWGGIVDPKGHWTFESKATNTGGIYDPAKDEWRAISMTDAPAGRFGHTAVWIDGQLAIWGGSTETGRTNTGGIYDPAKDEWRAMATVGAPLPREVHTAVWTGSKMLVWGGQDDDILLNDGAAYDPANDSWEPINTSNAPMARSGHTAVWTGSRMVVWGGHGTDFLNDGGSYDPAAKQWARLDGPDQPTARTNHAAVWAENRMLIWGGASQPSVYVGEGASYSP